MPKKIIEKEKRGRFEVESAGEIRGVGRYIARHFWDPYKKNHIFDPSTKCRGYESYPNAQNDKRFGLQLQYMLLYIQPCLAELDKFAQQVDSENWDAVKDVSRSSEVFTRNRIERELREAWKGRPKSK
jgi:hypothetical protein